jgi:hypothetical protein
MVDGEPPETSEFLIQSCPPIFLKSAVVLQEYRRAGVFKRLSHDALFTFFGFCGLIRGTRELV